MVAAGPAGFVAMKGDLPGHGDSIAGGSTDNVASYDACASLCLSNNLYQSFEYSVLEKRCNRSPKPAPTERPYRDYVFCSRLCPAGYVHKENVNLALPCLAPVEVTIGSLSHNNRKHVTAPSGYICATAVDQR